MIKKIKTKGMHCPSCEKIIEKTALKIEGVRAAKSDFSKEETEIEYDEYVTNLDKIKDVIAAKGYECCSIVEEQIIQHKIPEFSKKEDEYFYLPKINSRYFFIAGALLFLLGLFWVVKYSFSFSFPTVTPGMGLAVIFVVGLLTSFHCVGMCGGFVLGYSTKDVMETKEKKSKFLSHLKYGIGKTSTYVILGALFGLLGSFVTFSPMFKGVAALVAGSFLIIYGLNMLNIFPWLRKLQFRGPKLLEKVNSDAARAHKGPFVIGLLNGLMIACGPLQAMLIYAAGTGNVIQGALAMFVFGIGTLPLMLGFGSIATMIGSKFTHKVLKISALIVIVLGIIMVNRGLILTGTGYDMNSIVTSVSAAGSAQEGSTDASGTVFKDGYQEIRMDVTNKGWEPDKFILKKGVPVKWIINGKEINGCNNAIQVPKYGLKFDIKPGEQTIEFTPDEAGVIPWSCWMGMIPGTFIVKDDVDLSNTAEVQKELDAVPMQQGGSCGGASGGCGCGGAGGA
jgi:sulfite exporter TauE/SafE/copper chaperone CopZ